MDTLVIPHSEEIKENTTTMVFLKKHGETLIKEQLEKTNMSIDKEILIGYIIGTHVLSLILK